jgi:hypothetical protein
MTVETFIHNCSKAIEDPGLNFMLAQDWLDILNSQSSELYPEIGYMGTKTDTIANLYAANNEYQLDLSTIIGIKGVKEVFLIENSKSYPYANWIYHEDRKMLEMMPATSKIQEKYPGDYTSYSVIYFTLVPEFTQTGTTIALDNDQIAILQKVCIKEAVSRILNDHIKLDRYRTLIGRMNEYALMAMKRDLTTEIEITKRKLVNTHPVRAF